MKMKLMLTIVLVGLVMVFGCSKKDQPTEQPKAESDAPSMAPSMMDTVKEKAVAAAKESFTMDVDPPAPKR